MLPILSLAEWCRVPVGALIARNQDRRPIRVLGRLPSLLAEGGIGEDPARASMILGEYLSFSAVTDGRTSTATRLFHFAGFDWQRLDAEDVARFVRERSTPAQPA